MDKKPYDIDRALEPKPGRRKGTKPAPESFGGEVARELSRAAAASVAAERHHGGERWSWHLGLRVVSVRVFALLWLATAFFVAYTFMQADAVLLRARAALTTQATLVLGGRMLLTIVLTVVVALVAWQAMQVEKWAARALQTGGVVMVIWWWWMRSSSRWPPPVAGTETLAAMVFGWWLPVLGIITVIVIAFGGNALSE